MRALIEDELFLAEALQAGLRHEAIAKDIVFDGDAALERIAVNDYNVIVLDRDIPGTHGNEVCAVVARDYSGVRVLLLTATLSSAAHPPCTQNKTKTQRTTNTPIQTNVRDTNA